MLAFTLSSYQSIQCTVHIHLLHVLILSQGQERGDETIFFILYCLELLNFSKNRFKKRHEKSIHAFSITFCTTFLFWVAACPSKNRENSRRAILERPSHITHLSLDCKSNGDFIDMNQVCRNTLTSADQQPFATLMK